MYEFEEERPAVILLKKIIRGIQKYKNNFPIQILHVILKFD